MTVAPDWTHYDAPYRRDPYRRGTASERLLCLRLMLTRARDALERHRDPMVREIDRVLNE